MYCFEYEYVTHNHRYQCPIDEYHDGVLGIKFMTCTVRAVHSMRGGVGKREFIAGLVSLDGIVLVGAASPN